ncbi:MAG: glycosyltransferase [Candidatus Schekmanbacteria bacterium]|nr:glycosyltransferase [Candidatus Schekmanbacteria bacterium]
MSVFENNISILKEKNPVLASEINAIISGEHIEILESRRHTPTLKISGQLYHSIYDPKQESASLIEKFLLEKNLESYSSIVIFGMGIGYHVEELLKSNSNLPVIVIEPDKEILRAALEARDIGELLSSIFIFSPDKGNEDFFVKDIKDNAGPNPLIFTHPSFKRTVHNFNYSSILNKLSSFNPEDYKGLGVMVVYPLYGGSYPIAEYTSLAFEKLGCRVERFDMSRFYALYKEIDKITYDKTNAAKLKGLFLSLIGEMFVARVLETRPSMIFALAQSPLSMDIVKRIKPLKIPLCYWFVEDYRLMQYWKDIVQHYDYFFTIQKGEFHEEIGRMGMKNYFYLPAACHPDIHKPLPLEEEEMATFKSDVSFMGAGYYNRRSFFKMLRDYDFKIWGTDWPNDDPFFKNAVQRDSERISIEDTVKIFNSTKINLNMHSSTYHSGVNPHGDFVNPRTFEIAACGGFQLVDYRSDLEGLFKVGEEIETFSDIQDLRRKMSYYLDHPEERNKISEKARQKVLADHTYEKRMTEVLRAVTCGEGTVISNPVKDINSYKNLMKQASGNNELEALFSKFEGYDRLTISEVADKIRKGEGTLTRSEMIFLMMREFVAA